MNDLASERFVKSLDHKDQSLHQRLCSRGNKYVVLIWSSHRDQHHACVLQQVEAGAYQMSVKKANNLDGGMNSL